MESGDSKVGGLILKQFVLAVGFFAAGAFSLWLAVFGFPPETAMPFRILAGVAGVYFLISARASFRLVGARRYGIRVEKKARHKAQKLLSRRGFVVSESVVVKGLGDIDMVVSDGALKTAIEIKAYHSWDAKNRREQGALEQARRGMHRIGADRSVLWLPNGNLGWFYNWFGRPEADVRVVAGSARRLLRVLRRR